MQFLVVVTQLRWTRSYDEHDQDSTACGVLIATHTAVFIVCLLHCLNSCLNSTVLLMFLALHHNLEGQLTQAQYTPNTGMHWLTFMCTLKLAAPDRESDLLSLHTTTHA